MNMKNLIEKIKRNRLPAVTGAVILLLGLAVSLGVLYSIPAFTPDNVYALKLTEEELYLPVGETHQMESILDVLRPKGTGRVEKACRERAVVFASSDEKIAAVDEGGRITCLSEGSVTLTAAWGPQTAQLSLQVYIPVEDVRLTEKKLEMNVSEKEQLKVQVVPEDATYYEPPVYEVLTKDLISVDEEGQITALKPGTARVRMRSGEFTDTAVITIYAPLTSVELTEKEGEVRRGESLAFHYTYLPEDTTDDITPHWSLSDPEMGKISEEGLLTPLKPGEFKVILEVGDFKDEASVSVTAPLERLELAVQNLDVRAGDSLTIPVSFFPEDTTDDTTVTWTSSDPGVVSVNEAGLLTAVNAGTAVISAACQELTAVCTVKVVIPVSGVTISQAGAVMNKGDVLQLSAAVLPANTTEEPYISWSSDNIRTASVENGLVRALAPGQVNIVAAHDDFTAVCTVNVLSPMTEIRFEQTSLTLSQDASTNLALIFLPEDTTDERSAVWSSSNPAVASVNNGVITAYAPGECTISAVHGSLTASCHVTVTPRREVTDIVLNTGSLSFTAEGQTAVLTAGVYPADAVNAAVSFASTDPSVATVSGDGTVRAVGQGSCQIAVTAGAKTVYASVSVIFQARNVVVMLDPGHDGLHTGAFYYNKAEQEANLKVSLYCKSYLESHYAGVTVLLTHSDLSCPVGGADLKIDLEHRAQLAQNAGAAVLVSQHFNVSSGHTASGCVAYISKQGNVYGQSAALAGCILNRISGAFGIPNRGCETANSLSYFDSYGNPLDYYAINRHSANRGIPGIIIEHCFMDNASDMAFLTNDEYLARFGAADAMGIADYLGLAAK